jgi:hypothetical protein
MLENLFMRVSPHLRLSVFEPGPERSKSYHAARATRLLRHARIYAVAASPHAINKLGWTP